MIPATDIHNMTLDGGMPCLDLVNSGYDEAGGAITERMHSYADLLTLAFRCGLIDRVTFQLLTQKAVKNSRLSASIYRSALELRTAMYEIFSAMAGNQLSFVSARSLRVLNEAISMIQRSRRLLVKKNELIMDIPVLSEGDTDLHHPLRQFIVSAEELFTRKDQSMIRQCAGCDWVFLDETKNHRRRWCSMESCGSQAKSRRYYERTKGRSD